MPRQPHVVLRVPEEARARWTDAAGAAGVTLSAFVRDAVEEHLGLCYEVEPASSPVPHREWWGCTTFGCEWGFEAGGVGDERDMPREWGYCPKCGGELTEIRQTPMAEDFGCIRHEPAGKGVSEGDVFETPGVVEGIERALGEIREED